MSARELAAGAVLGLLVAVVGPAVADTRPSVDAPEHQRVPATIKVNKRHAEQLRHQLLVDQRNRVAALRVCKLGHTDPAHCYFIPVADIHYGAPHRDQ